MDEKIPYWKSNRFLGAFILQDGKDGCFVCRDDNVRLSLDRPPPPLRDQPPPPKIVKPKVEKKPPDEHQFILNCVAGITKVVETKRRFRTWLDSPDPPRPPASGKPAKKVEEPIPAFDIQQIPDTIRALGMPKAAKIFDKWFAGELNYSPDDESARDEKNQNGIAYPESMVDRTSISLDWVLQFKRAQIEYERIQTHEWLTRTPAINNIKEILSRNRASYKINSEIECGGDIQKIHKLFQFQLAKVEDSMGEKFSQFLLDEVLHRGIPDELAFIMGVFNFYAAISHASYGQDAYGEFGVVTHIYVYAKDSFTFSDKKDNPSQYLGHWNKKHVALAIFQAGSSQIPRARNNWIDHPIMQDPLKGEFSLMYPVKNSDFRAWQLKHNQGGDYILYTNKRGIMLKQPIKVYLK